MMLTENSRWDYFCEVKDDPRAVRVGGRHFFIGDEPSSEKLDVLRKLPFGNFLGFGGSEFRIRFFDGREVVTHNLRHNGEIPQDYRAMLPDNAEFVENET